MLPRFDQLEHVHIVGVCGTLMGSFAAFLRRRGIKVTGSDQNVYPPMSDQLRALGIDLIEGYGADQMGLQPDCFVVGNVVSRARTPDGKPRIVLVTAGHVFDRMPIAVTPR